MGPVTDQPRRGSFGGSLVAAAGLVAVVTLASRALGFVRTLVQSAEVGAGTVGTVFQTVNAVPNMLFEVAAGGVLAAVAVPIVAGHLGSERTDDAGRAASALLTWTVSLLLPLSVLLWALAPEVSGWLLEGAAPGSAELGAEMLRFFAPQVLLYGVGIVLGGILQAHQRFLAAALAPLLSSLVAIATFVAYADLAGDATEPGAGSTATTVLAAGITIGVATLSLPLFLPALRTGWRYRPTFSFPPEDARRLLGLAGAGILALAAQQAALLVTVRLANASGATGTVNVYAYVQAVYLLPYAVLAVPVATAAFPALARSAGAARTPQPTVPRPAAPRPAAPRPAAPRPEVGEATEAVAGAGTLARSLRAVLWLSGLGAALLVAVARPVGTFFQEFDAAGDGVGADALAATDAALLSYAPGLIGLGAAAVLTKALYVRGRPLAAGATVAGGWLTAAVLPLLLVPPGVGPWITLRALGTASSLGMSVAAAVLALLVSRAWGAEVLAGAGRAVGVAIVSVAVGGGLGDWAAAAIAPTSALGAVGAGAVAAGVCLATVLVVLLVGDRQGVLAVRDRGRARRAEVRGRDRGGRGSVTG